MTLTLDWGVFRVDNGDTPGPFPGAQELDAGDFRYGGRPPLDEIVYMHVQFDAFRRRNGDASGVEWVCAWPRKQEQ